MLDIRFVRQYPELVQRNAEEKGYKNVNIQEVLALDSGRRDLQAKADELREKRNTIAASMKGGKPSPELIEEGKAIKEELATIETDLRVAEEKFAAAFNWLPNMMQPDVPLGGEEDSVEIKAWGEKTEGAVDHLDFATKRDWVDFERGAKVAGEVLLP